MTIQVMLPLCSFLDQYEKLRIKINLKLYLQRLSVNQRVLILRYYNIVAVSVHIIRFFCVASLQVHLLLILWIEISHLGIVLRMVKFGLCHIYIHNFGVTHMEMLRISFHCQSMVCILRDMVSLVVSLELPHQHYEIEWLFYQRISQRLMNFIRLTTIQQLS